MSFLKNFAKNIDPTRLLFFGYLSYVLIGWTILCIPFSMTTNINPLDNLFTTVSAISTTGLVTVSVSDSYTLFGQIIIIILIQIGGIGYMTFGSFIILSQKKEINDVRKKVLETSFSLPKHFSIFKFVRSIVIYTIIVEFVGAIVLFFIFLSEDRGTPFWNAIFHSISSFCTAGFSLFNDSFELYKNHFWLNFIVSILSILGAIGYIVVIDFWLMIKGKQKTITQTSKIILSITFILIIFGTFIIFITEPSVQSYEPAERILVSFFQSMTSLTTVGFNTIPIGKLGLSVLFLLNVFMIIGASPSGTGGGIKSTTLSAVLGVLFSTLKKKDDIYFRNKKIPYERVIHATCTVVFYILILFLGIYLLSLSEKFDFTQLFFEAASALGTVGLSTGITGNLTAIGKIIITVLMFIGRLGPTSFGTALFYRFDSKSDEKDDDLVV